MNGVFSAYLEKPRRRPLNVLVGGIGALALVAVVLLLKPDPTSHSVVTDHGIRSVKMGMTEHDVAAVMRVKPLAVTHGSGVDCYRYGHPTLDNPVVTVIETCFIDGKLVSTTEKQFDVSQLDR